MKRAISIVLALMFVFALCACENKDSESKEKTKAYVGAWKMEDYTTETSQVSGFDVDVTMNVNEDETFTVVQTMSASGISGDKTLTGTYTADGDELTFTTKHSTTKTMGQTSEQDENETFTGTLKDNKMFLKVEGATLTMVKK